MKSFIRFISFSLAIVSLFFGVLPPLFYGSFHTGTVGLTLFGGALLALILLWDRVTVPGQIDRKLWDISHRRPVKIPRWWRRFRAIAAIGLAAVFTTSCVFSAFMIQAAHFTIPAEPSTVVVLGCQVKNGQPSLMLRRRLDAALVYLRGNPAAPVVCSGGLDSGELYSEGQVMEQYLLAQGIDPARIFTENTSRNTQQNMQFSAEIISRQNLPPAVAIATDGFHQLRGAIFARKNNLVPAALSCETPWGLLPSYWVREWFGIARSVFP